MAPEFKFLRVSVDKKVATIVLNRPEKMNSLCMELRDELEQCFGHIESDDDIGSVILTGGTDAFCPGFDIAELVNTNLESFTHRILEYHMKILEEILIEVG